MSITDNIKINVTDKKRHIQEAKIDDSSKKQHTIPNRCFTCNKKIGLVGIQCKCTNYFCTTHQYSDCHNCTFDYKSYNKDLLEKANPHIKPTKINSL